MNSIDMRKPVLFLVYFLLLFFTVSCSDPAKKQNRTEEFLKKEINNLLEAEDIANPKELLNKAKELKKRAEEIHYDLGVLGCNLIIMNKLSSFGKFKEAIIVSKENEVLIKKIKRDDLSCLHYTYLGAAYSNLGLVDEGLNYLNEALKYNNKMKDGNKKYLFLGVIYADLAFLEAMRNKSPVPGLTKKYYQKELEALQKIDDSKDIERRKNSSLAFLYLNLGVTSNREKKTKEAKEYFHKALDICKKYNIIKDAPLIVHNEMSWLLYDEKEYDSCIAYAQKGIILEKSDSKPQIRRDLFEVLYESYSNKGDLQNSAKYTKLYMKLNDSILDAQEIAINDPVKNIVQKKEKDHKSNLINILAIIGAGILILGILTFLLWRRNQKVLHTKYENIISELKNEENKTSVEVMPSQPALNLEKSLNINDSTISTILQKLDKFEKSEKFLKKEMNLSYLANSLDTNPRYLSEIINQYKGKNVNNYLNGLRIHRITELLYKEPVFREYKITYLAEYCGFASREVFAAAFKKETGVTPSYFINQLTIDEKNT